MHTHNSPGAKQSAQLRKETNEETGSQIEALHKAHKFILENVFVFVKTWHGKDKVSYEGHQYTFVNWLLTELCYPYYLTMQVKKISDTHKNENIWSGF
jgi:hypothetical protein